MNRTALLSLLLVTCATACVEPPEAPVDSPDQGTDMTVSVDADMDAPTPTDQGMDAGQRDMGEEMDMPRDAGVDMEPDAQPDMAPSLCENAVAGESVETPVDVDGKMVHVICFREDFEFVRVVENKDEDYVLGQDIDLANDEDFTWVPLDIFEGTLDGRGFAIKNITLTNDAITTMIEEQGCQRLGENVPTLADHKFVGGFINEVLGTGRIENVKFIDLSVGAVRRLIYPLDVSPKEPRCFPLVGGLFGIVYGTGSDVLALSDIDIVFGSGVNSDVDGLFGGVAYRIRNAMVENVRVPSEYTIKTQQGRVAGFAVSVLDAQIRGVEFLGALEILSDEIEVHSSPGTSRYVSTGFFIGEAIDSHLENILVRGSMERGEENASVPGTTGGLVGLFNARRAGTMSNASASISNCVVDVDVDIESGIVGGMLGSISIFEDAYVDINQSSVGLLYENNPEPALLDSANARGGFVGSISINSMSVRGARPIVIFDNVFQYSRFDDVTAPLEGCMVAQIQPLTRASDDEGNMEEVRPDVEASYSIGALNNSGVDRLPVNRQCNDLSFLTKIRELGSWVSTTIDEQEVVVPQGVADLFPVP